MTDINDYTPPTSSSAMPTPPAEPTAPPVMPAPPVPSVSAAPASPASPAAMTQSLEDQNIFFLLGVNDGTNEEKEAFLDELQQVIWEDFLENDVELLITEEEMGELKNLLAQKELKDLELQEKIIIYLEKLIPDLEEIMLEKALELKEDMVRERVEGLREYFGKDSDKMSKLDQAEQQMNEGRWRDAAELLNSL